MAPGRYRQRGGQSVSDHWGGLQGMRNASQVEVPDKIKCAICLTKKPKSQFSNKQLGDLRTKINNRTASAQDAVIRCTQCNSGQRHEMHCANCDEIKALTQFSKAQRSNPDAARCLECVRQISETDPGKPVAKSRPVRADSDDEDYGDMFGDEGSVNSYDEDDAVPNGMASMSLSGRETSVRSGATSSAAPRGYIPQPRQAYSVASEQTSLYGVGSNFYGTAAGSVSSAGKSARSSRWGKAPKPEKEEVDEDPANYISDDDDFGRGTNNVSDDDDSDAVI